MSKSLLYCLRISAKKGPRRGRSVSSRGEIVVYGAYTEAVFQNFVPRIAETFSLKDLQFQLLFSFYNQAAISDLDFNFCSSAKDSLSTVKALRRNKTASAAPIRMSGQLALSTFTPTAATKTDILAMMSLREQSQVERILRSSDR
jgi:hypothetical protein